MKVHGFSDFVAKNVDHLIQRLHLALCWLIDRGPKNKKNLLYQDKTLEKPYNTIFSKYSPLATQISSLGFTISSAILIDENADCQFRPSPFLGASGFIYISSRIPKDAIS